MAEKKFGDILIAMAFGIFVLSVFSWLITDFDSQYVNSDGVGGDLSGFYNDTSGEYESTETSLWQDTNNGSVFSITAGSDVDVRGTSQAIKTTKDTPGTITSFVRATSEVIITHAYITTFIAGLIIVTGLILFFRFVRPGGA